MSVRRAHPEEWQKVRDLRLRALRDEPHAFSATYSSEADEPEEKWRSWLADFAVFVAGDWAGMTAAFLVDDGSARLIAMYVATEARGGGYGRALVTAVEEWAREQGAPRVVLWVKPDNDEARTLYERSGFRATGELREDGAAYFALEL